MAHRTAFTKVPERPDFPHEEETILAYWEQINAFNKQLEVTRECKPFTFYDGPPFATGHPHYGHICAGTIKDIVCRYFSQTGHYVNRRFGWDCHGLPVEHEIDKALNIKHRNQVLEMGIAKYNQECRSIVMRYSSDWRKIIGRSGRWIDFDNDYKTLDLKFMESVWWVFRQLWDKGLVYRGCKVMPYSNGCSTVLSNFETQQNYKEVLDPAIIVCFPLVNDPDTKFIAWTTTPWTLPSNLALAINPNFTYLKVFDKTHNTNLILAECRLSEMYTDKDKNKYEIKEKIKGTDLVGIEYIPLFDYFIDRRKDGCFRVIGANFVTDDTGTGIVHCAPGFGDDDYKACVKEGIIQPDDPPVPVDENGRFLDIVVDFKGIQVKDADKDIRKVLRQQGKLLVDGQTKHNYPFCWRSDTPLIYKAVYCWFIRVTDIKKSIVENNKKAYWVPSAIQEGRFNNWLEDAQDWCFSRNRFWGNPIPIWVSDDLEEQVCIGSIEELKQLTGVQDIKDLHRESIDHLTIPSKQGKGQLHRIEEIFDCWFESGSMPYAQQHYPFSMQEEQFNKIFPADFIAEGVDQTRGWFYTLNVLATALRNDTPYKNLIVNGLVLNKDGKKMSKRLKNYPDPTEIMNDFGADAMRLYLINSGLVKAETLNFSEEGVKGVVRDVFLPWYNAYRFLIQNIQRFEQSQVTSFRYDEQLSLQQDKLTNLMDKWIVSMSETLIQFVRQEMEKYRLYTVIPRLVQFLDLLTNWYVRLNRPRLKGESSVEDWSISLNVLFDVLLKITILLSPFVPFITDSFYQNLRKAIATPLYQAESIHLLRIPDVRQELIDASIELDVLRMQNVIMQARQIREKHKISLKQPISSLTVISSDEGLIKSLDLLKMYIGEEVNTPTLRFETNVQQYLELKAEPDNRICGKELGEKFSKDFIAQIRSLPQDRIRQLQTEGKLHLKVIVLREKEGQPEEEQKQEQPNKKGGKAAKKKKEFEEVTVDCEVLARHILVKESYKTDQLPKHIILSVEDGYSLLMDTSQDEKLKNQGLAREFTNRIQKLRKKAGLNVEDRIFIFYDFPASSSSLAKAIESEFQVIQNQVKKPIFPANQMHPSLTWVENGSDNQLNVEGQTFTLTITWEGVLFNNQKLAERFDKKQLDLIVKTIGAYTYKQLKDIVQQQQGVFKFALDGKEVVLRENEDFRLNAQ